MIKKKKIGPYLKNVEYDLNELPPSKSRSVGHQNELQWTLNNQRK